MTHLRVFLPFLTFFDLFRSFSTTNDQISPYPSISPGKLEWKMPQKSLSTESVIDKLVDSSRLIQQRPGLKPPEENRVTEAFNLLATGPPSKGAKGAKQRTVYLEFLQRVNATLGRDKVVLCAAILGPSSVAGMRDRVRVELPHRMKERSEEFHCGVLQSLGDIYFARCMCINILHLESANRNSLPSTAHRRIEQFWRGRCHRYKACYL
jgi:hypothetical protein